MRNTYPPEVHEFIRNNVKGRTARELAELTNAAFGTNFNHKTMKCYKANHRLNSETKTGKPKGLYSSVFPKDVCDYIARHYEGIGPKQMTEMVNFEFGSEYRHSQIAAFYKNHHLNSGKTGRFEKGHEPKNKGMKGIHYPGSEKGHFQKGNKPFNTMPVGSVVKKSDGYFWEKIGEGKFDWKQLHILLWERAGKHIPDGHVLIFKDGNKENCVLENLMLISRAENAVMNKHGLRFSVAEYTETGHLIAQVKIAQRKRKKGATDRSEINDVQQTAAQGCDEEAAR